jgi:hypothetical protein
LEGTRLYALLRKEYLQYYKTLKGPLSSDAFTRFGREDSAIHNAEVSEATVHLFTEKITAFCKQMQSLQIIPMHAGDLCIMLHQVCENIGSFPNLESMESI